MNFSELKKKLENEKINLSDMKSELRFIIKQLSDFGVNIDNLEDGTSLIQENINVLIDRENKIELKLNKLFGENYA